MDRAPDPSPAPPPTPNDPAPASEPRPPYFPGGQPLAFFLLLVAILLLAWYTVRPVLVTVLFAAAVASLSHGLYRRLTRLLRGHARVAAFTMLAGATLGVLGPIVALIVVGAQRIAAEVAALVPRLPEAQGWLASLAKRAGPAGPAIRHASEQLGTTVSEAMPRIAQRATEIAGAAGSAILEFGAAFFLFAIAVYYFYLNGEPWRDRLIRLLPIEPRHTRAFVSRFRQVSVAVLVGNLGTALLHGVISGIGYVIFGVPAPFLWAVATAFASFIPLFGSALVWLPLSVALVVSSGWLKGLLLFAYCAVIVGLSDNLARPLLMEKRLGLHPLFVFIAIFGGLASFGAAGLFLGPLVMALTVAALDIYEKDSEEEQALRPVE